jgi:hypothetical protein
MYELFNQLQVIDLTMNVRSDGYILTPQSTYESTIQRNTLGGKEKFVVCRQIPSFATITKCLDIFETETLHVFVSFPPARVKK